MSANMTPYSGTAVIPPDSVSTAVRKSISMLQGEQTVKPQQSLQKISLLQALLWFKNITISNHSIPLAKEVLLVHLLLRR